MTNERIDILCAITYVYKRKKLAIMCPIGRMQQSKENFDIKNLALMFNAPIDITYPCDAVCVSENMLEPIVKAFGRRPDESYSMIVDIEETDTNESITELKHEFDNLYPITKHLTDKGYKIYPVFYVINNIDKFKDFDDYEKNDDNYGEIIRIKQEDFDLESFIKYMREISRSQIAEDQTPALLEWCDEKFEINTDILDNFGANEIIDTEYINKYINDTKDSAIGFVFGFDDMSDNIELITGEKVPYDFNVGEMEFYENTAFSFTMEVKDGYYIFKACELYLSYSNYKILEDAGDLQDLLIDVILKYKK